MKNKSILAFTFFFFFFCFFFSFSSAEVRKSNETQPVSSEGERASTPPRGWNSYDSFCWTISEEEFLQSADIISNRLKPHGYQYAVVDYLWYRKKVNGSYTDAAGFDVIDEWGRVIPDPARWPSSEGGKGFSQVAEKVHSMGLKFGIHVMRGISLQAFNANTLILDPATGSAYKESGRLWRAKDIGVKERACAWMSQGFMSVNTKLGAGRAFLRSLYLQYAEWGVDFVKNDCVFGDDLDINEISFVSEILRNLDRPILYSLSPGTSVTPAMAKDVSGLVNMYRITGDDWDSWRDVASHFDVSRDFAASKMIGAKGLLGKSWPDLDMLPLGWLTDPGSNEGPHRKCDLNLDEQRTQMTLWAMARSPLMFGGDVRNLDNVTYSLITNPTLLEINSFSSNNMEFPYITAIKESRIKNKALSEQLTEMSDKRVLGLTTCKDRKGHGWLYKALDQDPERICWKEKPGSKFAEFLCLYKRLPSGEEMINRQKNLESLYSLAYDGMELCLDASPRRRLTAKESAEVSFSPCKWDANQMWKLNATGALINSYSGLCATVNSLKADVIPVGIRSWVATGRKGEIYLAFFNLNSEKTVISAKIADLPKVLTGIDMTSTSCKYLELWTGASGETKELISLPVEMHGSALFVLHCS